MTDDTLKVHPGETLGDWRMRTQARIGYTFDTTQAHWQAMYEAHGGAAPPPTEAPPACRHVVATSGPDACVECERCGADLTARPAEPPQSAEPRHVMAQQHDALKAIAEITGAQHDALKAIAEITGAPEDWTYASLVEHIRGRPPEASPPAEPDDEVEVICECAESFHLPLKTALNRRFECGDCGCQLLLMKPDGGSELLLMVRRPNGQMWVRKPLDQGVGAPPVDPAPIRLSVGDGHCCACNTTWRLDEHDTCPTCTRDALRTGCEGMHIVDSRTGRCDNCGEIIAKPWADPAPPGVNDR